MQDFKLQNASGRLSLMGIMSMQFSVHVYLVGTQDDFSF